MCASPHHRRTMCGLEAPANGFSLWPGSSHWCVGAAVPLTAGQGGQGACWAPALDCVWHCWRVAAALSFVFEARIPGSLQCCSSLPTLTTQPCRPPPCPAPAGGPYRHHVQQHPAAQAPLQHPGALCIHGHNGSPCRHNLQASWHRGRVRQLVSQKEACGWSTTRRCSVLRC